MKGATPLRPILNLRSRKEISTRDAVNIRRFEHWQTDAPSLQNDRADVHGPRVLSDMNPINSRSLDTGNYIQNRPMTAGQDSFTQNAYFNDYAPTFDPRNAIREVRSAIYENRFDRGVTESQKLLSRSFTNALEPEDALKAYESLKPAMNNIEKNYR